MEGREFFVQDHAQTPGGTGKGLKDYEKEKSVLIAEKSFRIGTLLSCIVQTFVRKGLDGRRKKNGILEAQSLGKQSGKKHGRISSQSKVENVGFVETRLKASTTPIIWLVGVIVVITQKMLSFSTQDAITSFIRSRCVPMGKAGGLQVRYSI